MMQCLLILHWLRLWAKKVIDSKLHGVTFISLQIIQCSVCNFMTIRNIFSLEIWYSCEWNPSRSRRTILLTVYVLLQVTLVVCSRSRDLIALFLCHRHWLANVVCRTTVRYAVVLISIASYLVEREMNDWSIECKLCQKNIEKVYGTLYWPWTLKS